MKYFIMFSFFISNVLAFADNSIGKDMSSNYQENQSLTSIQAKELFQKVQETKQPLIGIELDLMKKYHHLVSQQYYQELEKADREGIYRGELIPPLSYLNYLMLKDGDFGPWCNHSTDHIPEIEKNRYPLCWSCGMKHNPFYILQDSWKM